MAYPTYPDYIASEADWLGVLPSHWKVRRLRFAALEPLKYGANEAADLEDTELPRYIRITDVNADGSLNSDTFRSLTEEVAAPYLLEEGDILLARSGATVGKSFQYSISWGKAAYAGYLIRFRPDQTTIHPRFAYYYFQTECYWACINSTLIQATIQNFSAEKYNDLKFPLPSSIEQEHIADFLDYKTAQIDALIAKKKELIEKLKEQRIAVITQAVTKGLDPDAPMRDSGIDWLGNISKDWEVRYLKFCFDSLNNRRIPLSAEERASMTREYPYYGASGIIDYVDEYIFDEPTVLIAEDGANLLSRSTPLAFEARGKYWVNNHAHILRPTLGPFSYWSNLLCIIQYDPWITGAAQPKLTKDNLGAIPLPCPPKEEQEEIARFIDHQTQRIDPLIAIASQTIERLTEYRTALITAATTGKIDVRKVKLGKAK